MNYTFKYITVSLVLLCAACISYAQSAQSTNNTDSTSAPYCDSTLWNHVYHSYRLQVKNKCTTVTGVIQSLIYEADGDIHIRLKVDSAYRWMLNDTNRTGQHNDLVCEPICATTVKQTDAIVPCSGLKNTVYIPSDSEYVIVTGSYVHDKDHGWNEIHPVTSISIIYHTDTKNPGIEKAPLLVYPNPCTDIINFHLIQKTSSPIFITIVDGLGRSAGHYQMMTANNLQITTSYLPEGVYYYTVIQNNIPYNSGQFIVIHAH